MYTEKHKSVYLQDHYVERNEFLSKEPEYAEQNLAEYDLLEFRLGKQEQGRFRRVDRSGSHHGIENLMFGARKLLLCCAARQSESESPVITTEGCEKEKAYAGNREMV